MGVLDQVMQMRSQGKEDQEIIRNLQQRGVSPKDIQDALNQAQIKNAVAGNPAEGMQESIMENPPEEIPEAQEYTPAPTEYVEQAPAQDYPTPPQYAEPQPPQEYVAQPPQEYQSYTPQEGDYAQGYGAEYGYDQGAGYGYSAASDSGTLIEIAEQVFTDKIKKIEKTLEDLNEFKTLAETQIKGFEERLRRIEATIDQLQISILEKIGSYGKNLSSVKKEMAMMQDSFSKVINPVLDKKTRKKTS